jgi:hypothetical protein
VWLVETKAFEMDERQVRRSRRGRLLQSEAKQTPRDESGVLLRSSSATADSPVAETLATSRER